jgi:transglutaminase-like putative cysteine protease
MSAPPQINNVHIRPETAPSGPGGNVTQNVDIARSALAQAGVRGAKKDRQRGRVPIPQGAPRSRAGAAYPQLVLAGLGVATTSVLYLRYFGELDFLIGTLTAAGAGALIGSVAGLRRWSALITAGVAALGLLLVGVFAVYRSTLSHGIPNWNTLKGLGSGLVSGWARMLSVSLPANATGELVITPAVLAFLAALAATTLVIRTKSLLAPALPLLIAFVAGLVLSAGRPLGGLVLVGVLLLEILLLALVRSGAADPLARSISSRVTWGKFLFGLPVVLVAAGAGVAGARLVPLATGDDRFDLRDVVPIQLDIDDGISPLVTLKSQLRASQRDLFTVRMTGDAEGIDRIRTVALDDYDGALWASRDRFLLGGTHLPSNATMVNPRRVSVNVSIKDLSGPYLPEIGSPIEMSAPRFGFSETSGTLATDLPSLSGLSYDLVADVGRRDGLETSVPAVPKDSTRYTTLPPGLPADVAAKGAQLAGAVAEPYAKLLAIQDYLQKLPYNLDSRPGHSYDALRRLFSSNPADQVGYAEQFAAAFAVLARSQGFPARVAVGYLLNKDRLKDSTYTVTTADAHAWAEVNLAGYGWVAFEPTDPQRRGGVAPKPPETPAEANKDNPKPDQNTKASQPTEDPNLPRVAAGGMSVLDWALWVLIGLCILVGLTPFAIAGEKFRRRQQRRAGPRSARIIGAWQQMLDRLLENGVPVTANLTATEIAHHANHRFGERVGAVTSAAPLVTKTIFSQDEPEESSVKEAWALDARLRRELRGIRSPFAIIRGWLDPRPLFARRRDDRRRRRELEKLTRG